MEKVMKASKYHAAQEKISKDLRSIYKKNVADFLNLKNGGAAIPTPPTTTMDAIINSALDVVEEHVVQRLEDTGLVTFDDADDIISKTTERGKTVVQKLKRLRAKTTKMTTRKKKDEEQREKWKKEDKENDAKLMEMVKAQKQSKPMQNNTKGAHGIGKQF